MIQKVRVAGGRAVLDVGSVVPGVGSHNPDCSRALHIDVE